MGNNKTNYFEIQLQWDVNVYSYYVSQKATLHVLYDLLYIELVVCPLTLHNYVLLLSHQRISLSISATWLCKQLYMQLASYMYAHDIYSQYRHWFVPIVLLKFPNVLWSIIYYLNSLMLAIFAHCTGIMHNALATSPIMLKFLLAGKIYRLKLTIIV